MKKIDWFFSLFLIIVGLTCLLFSANGFGHENLFFFGKAFVKVCMWVACPIIIFGSFYLCFYYKNKRQSKD